MNQAKKPFNNTKCNKQDCLTHQPLQDPLALVVGAVVGHDAPVDQNQAVQEQPGAEPEQSKHQGPPTGPSPEAQAAEQAWPATTTPTTWHQSSREHCDVVTAAKSAKSVQTLLSSCYKMVQLKDGAASCDQDLFVQDFLKFFWSKTIWTKPTYKTKKSRIPLEQEAKSAEE